MGSLISEMYGGEIVATLEVLSRHNLTAQDTEFLRTNDFGDFCARRIVKAWKEANKLILDAGGSDLKTSLLALEQLDQSGILAEVFRRCALPGTRVAIMEKLTSAGATWSLVGRYWGVPGYEEAVYIGLRRLLSREGRVYFEVLWHDSKSWLSRDRFEEITAAADRIIAEQAQP